MGDTIRTELGDLWMSQMQVVVETASGLCKTAGKMVQQEETQLLRPGELGLAGSFGGMCCIIGDGVKRSMENAHVDLLSVLCTAWSYF